MVRVIVAALLMLSIGNPLTEARYTKEDVEVLIREAEYGREFDKYQAFLNACQYTPYSCIKVPVPEVKYVRMQPGLLGYYDGGDTVYIKRGMRGIRRKAVLMHESVHYLQTQVGGLRVPGYAKEICRAEEEAFAAVDNWLIDTKRDSYKVGSKWWVPYKHCRQWYDPKWPKYSEEDTELWGL